MSSSIKILNPSNTWDVFTPKFLRVACPYTEEHARQKRNDWFFRCYFEYLDCKDRGGLSFWFTLTFNDDNLPRLQINKYIDCVPFLTDTPHSSAYIDVPDSETLPCFNSTLVSLFVKEMKIFLKRKGYDSRELKFLICSEYGEKFHRPHLHGCGFSKVKIEEEDLIDCLRRAWHYGFVGSGKKGFIMDSIAAVRYCTKYVCKDMSFYSANRFPSGRTLSDYINKQDAYEPSDLRRLLHIYLPQTISSKGIGACYIAKLNAMPQDERLKLCNFEKKVVLPLGRGQGLEFSLPRYYISKLSYYVHKDLTKAYGRTIMLLSDFGRLALRSRLQNRIANVEKRIREIEFNVCSNLGVLGDYYKVHHVDVTDLAWYIGYLRYLVPFRNGSIDPRITKEYVFANKEHLFSQFLADKVNVYVSDFLLSSGEVDGEWIWEHSGGSLFSRPLYCDNRRHFAIYSCTLSDLKEFRAFENAAQSFDNIMDAIFERNEIYKRNKRLETEADKHKCITSNPKLIKEYESI